MTLRTKVAGVSLLLLAVAAGTLVGAIWLTGKGGGARKPLPGLQVIRPPHEVSALLQMGEHVMAGGRDGLAVIDRGTGEVVLNVHAESQLRYVRALLLDREGNLWVGHFSGLTRFDGTSVKTFSVKDGLPDDRVNALCLDNLGRLWAGTWGGAAVLENGAWRKFTRADGLADDMVNVIFLDREGELWFGSYVSPRGGLSLFALGKWRTFTTGSGLPHNNVNGIFQDRDGDVWVCTGFYDRGGLARFTRQGGEWSLARVLTQKDGLPGAKSRSVFQRQNGVFWLGSEYDGMAVWDGRRWGYLKEADGLPAQETKVILEDTDENLWLGTSDGVAKIRADQLDALEESQMGPGLRTGVDGDRSRDHASLTAP